MTICRLAHGSANRDAPAKRHPIAEPEQRRRARSACPSQKPGIAKNTMLMNRETLSPRLLGRSALTIATGIPTSQDRITAIMRDFRGQRSAPRYHLANAFRAEERPAEISAGDVSDPVTDIARPAGRSARAPPCSERALLRSAW